MSGPQRDLRGTATWGFVDSFLRRLHEPGFGNPSDLYEVDVDPLTGEIVTTALVRDELKEPGRRAVVAVRDGGLVPLLAGRADSFSPRFSADGAYLAFLSARRTPGVSQLHVLPRDLIGEADEIPIPGIVEELVWSPAGAQLVCRVAGLGADKSGAEGSGTHPGGDDGPAWLPHVEGSRRSAETRSLWLVDVPGRRARRVTDDDVAVWEVGWAGPGRGLAITSIDRTESGWYTAELSLIDLDTGKRETVLTSDVQLGLPAGAPDGRHIAVVEAVCSDRGVVAGDVLLIDDTGGKRRIDTGGVDVSHLRWLSATQLSFAGIRNLDSVVGVLDVAAGTVSELWCSGEALGSFRYPDAAVLPDGRVVASRQGYRLPPQIALHTHGETAELASTAHPGTADVLGSIGECEPISWTAADGWQIDGLLTRPDTPGPHPLIVHVHGGPIWAYRQRWLMSYPWVPLLVSRGYAVLHANPRGAAGKGQRFAAAVVGDFGGADAQDLLAGIDSLAERGLVDPDRVGVMGGSYGGFMSCWLITQDPRFKAAVPIAPVTHWRSQHYTSNIPEFDAISLDRQPMTLGAAYDERSPLMHARKVRTPTLSIAGALDRCTPPSEALQFHRALDEHGVESAFVLYPQEGHGARSYPAVIDLCTRIIDWFETFMPV